MPKKVCTQNYQNAYDIIYGEWISIHPCDCMCEEDKEYPLSDENISSDQKIIKGENFSSLSNEAKEIIKAVLYSPEEILLMLTPKTKKVTLRGVKRYFEKKWKSAFITQMAIKEITAWVSKL